MGRSEGLLLRWPEGLVLVRPVDPLGEQLGCRIRRWGRRGGRRTDHGLLALWRGTDWLALWRGTDRLALWRGTDRLALWRG
ncbi:MAG: hypothetical protein JXA67_17515, partial [Micromonosporaceae bacterium]|nr:hypothetical protein [Micromonosporaceae bacterium]